MVFAEWLVVIGYGNSSGSNYVDRAPLVRSFVDSAVMQSSIVARRLAGGVASAALVLAVAACGAPSPSEAVDGLEATFPILSEFAVTGLYRSSECEYFVYARGAFVTDPTTFECQTIDVEGPRQRAAFDTDARRDLDAIYRESERHGSKIQMAYPQYGPDGTIVGGNFGYDVCTSYAYEPGWTSLPDSDSSPVTAVNDNWWQIACPSAF